MTETPTRAHLIRLGRFLEQEIEKSGLSINEFAKKTEIATSTVYQIVKGQAQASYKTAKKFSRGLAMHCNVKVSPEELLEMIDEVEDEPEPEIRPIRDTLPPSTLLWHLQRISILERTSFWAEALKLASQDIEAAPTTPVFIALGENPRLDILIGMIHAAAAKHKLKNSCEFTTWLFSDGQRPDDYLFAVEAFLEIWIHRRLPYRDIRGYVSLMPALAKKLGFDGETELLSYCGLIAVDSPAQTDQSEVELTQR
jgi:plasmid maintenance system antidote protein VapI